MPNALNLLIARGAPGPTWDFNEEREKALDLGKKRMDMAQYPEEVNWLRQKRRMDVEARDEARTRHLDELARRPFKDAGEMMKVFRDNAGFIKWSVYPASRAWFIQHGAPSHLFPEPAFIEAEAAKEGLDPSVYFEREKEKSLTTADQAARERLQGERLESAEKIASERQTSSEKISSERQASSEKIAEERQRSLESVAQTKLDALEKRLESQAANRKELEDARAAHAVEIQNLRDQATREREEFRQTKISERATDKTSEKGPGITKIQSVKRIVDEEYANFLGADISDLPKKMSAEQKAAHGRVLAFAEQHAKTMEPRAAVDQALKDWWATFGKAYAKPGEKTPSSGGGDISKSRQDALDAIRRGADPAAVRKRFREKYGQDLGR
jgi:hypothetical protein